MSQMQLAVNHAINSYKDAMSRHAAMMGSASLDAKRPQTWCEFGFPEQLEFSDFYNLYRRRGIAFGAVDKLNGKCWETFPWVIEGEEDDESRSETAWEREVKRLVAMTSLWRELKKADHRRLVGRYSGVILHFNDIQQDHEWKLPVQGGKRVLTGITVAWQSALKPLEHDSFGEVSKWQYKPHRGNVIEMHPDRVFLLGSPSPDEIPFLEPAYNNFVSMEKVSGGSAESFLKNAARQLGVNFDKEVNLDGIASMYGVSLEDLHTKFNDAARELNRANDLLFITQGATTTPLVSNVPDPRPSFDVNLQEASAALDIPSRILVGNQQGERASTEDNKYFNKRCQSRRGDLGYEVQELLQHLMSVGALSPKDQFCVMWDDLSESESSEKLGNAKLMSDINYASMGGEPVFTDNEIRTEAGFEPRGKQDPLPDDEDEEDD